MIPYGRQHVDDADIAAVVEVLESDWLTQGPSGPEFEDAIADLVGAAHAVSFSSATAALHGAASVGGLGSGDVVAVPALTFAASANCARYVGADVDLIDVDPSTLLLEPSAVGSAHDALVAVHFAGLAADLSQLAVRPRLIIEDAAHALGAVGPHGPVGNCANSDMCVFSFHPVKTVAAGEGGVVTTNSDTYAAALRRFRNHGMERAGQADPWAYEIGELGFNYRMSDLHAALGRSQLRKLPDFVARRNELADRYDRLLRDLPVCTPPGAPGGQRHARHLYPILVDRRREVFDELRARGIGVQVHYIPLHHLSRFAGHAHRPLPGTELVGAHVLSLPLFPDLTDDQQDQVVETLTAVVTDLGIERRPDHPVGPSV